MKKVAFFTFLFACLVFFSASSYAVENIYYARCNLKVIKGSYITWINWQATNDFIPAGTKLNVTLNGDKAELVDEATGKKYELDIGASGEKYLEKFVSKTPVSITKFSKEAQRNIKKTITKVGMTKEETYVAMGPPANANRTNTDNMTYEEIMKADLWVYKRRRFGKNIGVSFDSGKVDRTEGIWKD